MIFDVLEKLYALSIGDDELNNISSLTPELQASRENT